MGVNTATDLGDQEGMFSNEINVKSDEDKMMKHSSGSSSSQFHYKEILNEEELRKHAQEFQRVENACYLDHSGATLYAKSQIDAYHSELQSNLFSNPHSRNPSSSATSDAIDYIRLRILHHFGTNADDYSVIFTSGATSAMKLLAESFRFNGGLFAYLEESHTSVVGMRELVCLESSPSTSTAGNEKEFGEVGCTTSSSSSSSVGKMKKEKTITNSTISTSTSTTKSTDSSGPSSPLSQSHFDGESSTHSNSTTRLNVSPPQSTNTPTSTSTTTTATTTTTSFGLNSTTTSDPDSGVSTNAISPYASKVYCLAKAAMEKLMYSELGSGGECECESGSQPDDGSTTSLMSGAGGACESVAGRGAGTSTAPPESSIPSRTNSCKLNLPKNALMAYPAQCNFSGFKYPLDWIPRVQTSHLDSISQMDHFYIQEKDIDTTENDKIKNSCTTEMSRSPCPRCNLYKEDSALPSPFSISKEREFPPEGNFCNIPSPAAAAEEISPAQAKHEDEEEEEKQLEQETEMNRSNTTTPVNNVNFRQKSSRNSMESTCKPNSTYISTLLTQSEKVHEENCRRSSDHYKWFVLLDAASYVATNVLDLSLHPADFIAISFYKMFGFPTGLGALLVRNESIDILEKRYFGGGTVNIALPWKTFHVKRAKLHERFEDGTISFLSILAVGHGFDTMNKLGRSLDTISTRTFRLAQYFYKQLSDMKYLYGQPVAQIYSDTDYSSQRNQGPIVTFNLLRSDGTIIGYSEMEQIAYIHGVHLRYGCFCNPGACRRHLNLHPEDVLKQYEAGHVCGDMRDLIDGKPTGAIRVSFGYMTTQKNIDFLLHLIHACWILPFQVANDKRTFIENQRNIQLKKETTIGNETAASGDSNYTELQAETDKEDRKLLRIFVYPIKGCAPFEVSKTWAIGSRGLLYDREWLIVNSSGVLLTQKREPRLCQLKPKIDISNRRLVLATEGFPDLSVPLEISQLQQNTVKADLCTSKVCGDTISGISYGEEVNTWLSLVLGKPGLKLIRMSPDHIRKPRNALDAISLANHSQFLLVSMGSLTRLALELVDKGVASSLCSPPDGIDEEIIRRSNSLAETRTNIAIKPRIPGNGIDLKYREDESSSSTGKDIEGSFLYDWKQFKSPCTNNKFLDIASSAQQNELGKWTERIVENLIGRFRANFVIGLLSPRKQSGDAGYLTAYEEETWDEIQLGNVVFKSGGPCMRCATICMDPTTSQRSSEPLLTLSASREGKANFGIHLYCVSIKENRNGMTGENGTGNLNAVMEKGPSTNASQDLLTNGACSSGRSFERKSVLENRQLPSSLSSSDSLTSTFPGSSYNTTPTLIPSSKNVHSDATISTPLQTIHIGDIVNVNVRRIPNPSTDTTTLSLTSIHNPIATSNQTISLENKSIIDSID